MRGRATGETARRSGLAGPLSRRLGRWRRWLTVHDPARSCLMSPSRVALGVDTAPTSPCCVPSRGCSGRWPRIRLSPGVALGGAGDAGRRRVGNHGRSPGHPQNCRCDQESGYTHASALAVDEVELIRTPRLRCGRRCWRWRGVMRGGRAVRAGCAPRGLGRTSATKSVVRQRPGAVGWGTALDASTRTIPSTTRAPSPDPAAAKNLCTFLQE